MVLLAFLIDTSASMNQRTCLGTSYLDLAKGAVESFLKIRARDTNNSRGDRYMLVTYDEPTKSVKAGWRENLQSFMGELKNIEGLGLSDIGRALKETFDLLNMHRLQSGIDNYGMGRNPYYLEPALVLLLTDGCSPLDINGIMKEITMPNHNLLPGAELTEELYRWDQRLFTLQLKIPGFAQSITEKQLVLPEDMPLSNVCDQTGGKLYNIGSQKHLMQSLESIAQKMMIPGVIINFLKHGADPEVSPNEVSQDQLKTEENLYPENEFSNELNDANRCNGKMPFHINGVFDSKQNAALDSLQAHGLNGFVNGQGLLPTPPVGINRNFNANKTQPVRPLPNGIVDDNERQQIKTEGLSSSGGGIPDTPIRGNDEPMSENVLSPSANQAMSTAWHNQRRMIIVRNNIKGSVGHWPIPESFWPEATASRLAARNCQPIVKFTCKPVDAMVIDNMPFDKYELEPSPLTQYILERRQPNSAWQTFVCGSSPDSEIGYPFGYLKAASSLQCVNFFVLPYNYPVVMPLLDELFKVHKCKPSVLWKHNFQEYLQTVPSYYYVPLRNALRRMSAPNNLLPDHLDGSLSYSVVAYLKKLKHQAKSEADRLLGLQTQKNEADTFTPAGIPRVPQLNDGKLRDFKELLIQSSSNNRKKAKVSNSTSIDDLQPFARRSISNTIAKKQTSQTYRNPFDIRHSDILEHVARMRQFFFHITATSCDRKKGNDEQRHNVSIAQMGNYQDHVQQFKPLREVDPSQIRIHTFGNPFKLKQDQIIGIDEADIAENMPLGPQQRKRGGEVVVNLQKGKRKRSETPPPSRRPIGVPNTPPPKLRNNKNDESEKRNELLGLLPDHKGVLKDLTGSLDKINSLDNDGKEIDKKQSSNVVSKQLRKLQQMHRNKKENVEILNDKLDDLSEHFDAESPILSILRTSLEEPEDRDNDELSQITDEWLNDSLYEDGNSSGSNSTTTTPSKTPLSILLSPLLMEDMFRNMPEESLKNIYKQLHTRTAIKTRLAIWQAIRDRKEFTVIEDLVKRLSVEVETKYMFVMNLIYEAEKFQLTPLEDKLKTLLREIQLMKNGG